MAVRLRPSALSEGSSEAERLLAKEKVAGSSPVPRSLYNYPLLIIPSQKRFGRSNSNLDLFKKHSVGSLVQSKIKRVGTEGFEPPTFAM